jgi:hypothetical protein
MQQSDSNQGILEIPPGTKLRFEESSGVEEVYSYLLSQIAEERGDTPPSQDSLRDTIGKFLQDAGAEVAYGAPLGTDEAGPERSVFDIVASEGDQLRIVEVTDTVSQSYLDKMQDHLDTLRESDVHGKLYLGIDALNQFDIVSGALRTRVKELMTSEGLGIILADELLMVICDSHDQLLLDEMPTFFFLN